MRLNDLELSIEPIDSEELVADAVAHALVADGVGYQRVLAVSASRFPEDAIAEAFGIGSGELFGHTDQLRRGVTKVGTESVA